LSVSRFTRAQRRLIALAERYDLGGCQLAQLETLLEQLAASRHAPSAVRDASDAVDVHVADSLTALEVERVRAGRWIADLGSGAGFPGLPLAVALPRSRLWLVESQARRCVFLERMCSAAGITNAEVACARAEECVDRLGNRDVVLARAVAPQPVVLEYAAPLLRVDGLLVDWRGTVDKATATASTHAAATLGLSRVEVRRVERFPRSSQRYLHLYLKVRATPRQFPRRPGIARKRPLGDLAGLRRR
jgi:16S rRNA (guanine527-N7)-methyltransferase